MNLIFVFAVVAVLFSALMLISAIAENSHVQRFFKAAKCCLSTAAGFILELLMLPAWAFYKVFERN